jgi:hypothetical protein
MSDTPQATTHRIEIAAAKESATQDSPGEDFRRMKPEQFSARLLEAEQAGARRLLKALGIKKEDRSASLADIEAGRLQLSQRPKDGEPDYRAEYEKFRSLQSEHEVLKGRASKHAEFFKSIADEQFSALPEKAQRYIASRAGDDSEKVLAEIKLLKESGLLTESQPDTGSKDGPGGKPATTGSVGGPMAAPMSTKTAWQQYQDLMKVDKVLGGLFHRSNRTAVESSAPKK